MTKVLILASAALATAAAAHEINRSYCHSIGDDSQKPWDDAPDWQKESAIKGVEFHVENPDAGASASHDSWMAQKLADGWVYGDVKDETKKTHPCIVPFDQLPPEQQLKDVLFKATVHATYPRFAEFSQDAGVPQDQLDALHGHIDTATASLESAQSKVEERDREIADLKAKLADAEKAAKAAKLSAGDKTPRPRKIGPLADDKQLDRDALKEAIAKADKVEILFGDGKVDSGVTPVVVEGDAWIDHTLGLMLNEPVTVHGPAQGAQPYYVRGYALLLDGKQVAWCERPDPLTVGAGQKYGLSNDIFF